MMCELVFLFGLIGVNSVHPLSEAVEHLSPNHCPGQKCPPGQSSFCPWPRNEPTRCIPCVEGTFSAHASRRKACRPCSRCRDNEYEVSSCTRTSNVVCKICSECPPGLEVVKPCKRTRDTVCHHLAFVKRRKEKEKPKNSMTTIEVEVPPWPNGTRKPKLKDTPSPGFPGVHPSPSSAYGNSSSGSAPLKSVSTDSDVAISRPTEVSTRTSLASGKSIGLSLPSTFSAESSRGFNPTTISVSDANTKEPLFSDSMQGDGPRFPRHTRRRVERNGTRQVISLPPQSSPEPSEGVMIWPDFRGMPEESSTEFRMTKQTMLRSSGMSAKHEVQVGHMDARRRSGSYTIPLSISGAVVVIAVVAALVFLGVKKSKTLQGPKGFFLSCRSAFRSRHTRCHGSHCCDGNSVSSIVQASTDQTDGSPVSVTNINEVESLPDSNQTTLLTYLQTVTADVHRSTVFDLFPAIRSYPQFITRAEAIFNSTGGTLSTPDSNVSIKIESGAVPDGVSQPVSFGVVYDETLLFRDIPETPENTLISPVIQCGPENINLSKPVEIVLPHCLYVDEVKKGYISVYRCEQFSDEGPMNWEKVPSVSEKSCQSKAWFTVKKDTIHIKTRTFSFWSVFACGGPKRKRATVFINKPNPDNDLLYLRFYIYSDNEDSKKRVERIEQERFPDSKPAIEKPFKMHNDSKDITVWLDAEDLAKSGWELDRTPATQTYIYEMAYKDGFRSYDSCGFAVKPIAERLGSIEGFSGNLYFQQEDHPEHFIYVNPGITPLAKQRFSVERGNNNNDKTSTGNSTLSKPENTDAETEVHDAEISLESPATEISEEEYGREDEMVTRDHGLSICEHVGCKWKSVLRHLDMEETAIENVDLENKYVSEKFLQGLLQWMRNVGSQKATTRTLCNALSQAGCSVKALEKFKISKRDVGRRTLAPIPESTSDCGTSTCV